MKQALAMVLAAALSLSPVACAKKPVTAPRAVVPETVSSELRVAATAAKKFGDMVALGVGVSNGSAKNYVISADRVLALDAGGNRVAPLSVEEAARQAGGATALVAGLEGAGGGALLTGLLGAIPGALIGAAQGGGSGAAKGAAIGAGIGIAVGAVGGFYESKTKTEREIIDQLGGLYLAEKVSKPGLPVSGFVFFPADSYQGVRVVALEQGSGEVKEIAGPMVAQPGS
ncbi:MAG: hypothetical protein HY699_10860 [Deltaproteobacteria bacterium]|nr:hypothetical protein [Deltaproteobacteria bacterium]